MLEKLSFKVAYCHQRARECSLNAQRADNDVLRQEYLEFERRWMMLAESYSFGERLDRFTHEVQCRVTALKGPGTPVIPRVMCPECGKRMQLRKIEPHPIRRADKSTFECRCGNRYEQTVDRSA
jgi:hypothetical protein